MIWLTGIVAIVLMLAVLELDPSQLYTISSIPHQVGNASWQVAAYLFLLGAILLSLGGYVAKLSNQYLQRPANKPVFTSSLQEVTPQSPTWSNLRFKSWIQLSRQRFIKITFKLAMWVLLLFAVLCNSVAQRMVFIESSPQQTVYLEAIVTPVGLSDKRLEVVEGSVFQGYRQLVALTDIKFTSINQTFDRSPGDNKDSKGVAGATVKLLNPFNEVVNPELLAASKNTESNEVKSSSAVVGLPDKMIVMLQSYQTKHIKLNQLSADRQLRMKLLLKPLQLKDNNNQDEFDEYRWLSSRHATAKAFIVDSGDSFEVTHDSKTQISELTYRQQIDVMRFKFREHFLQLMSQRSSQFNSQQSVAVTLSLLTGDRSLISDDTTALYRFGGISHLLAISGTHVLFLAMLSATMVTALINKLQPSFYNVVPRWQCGFIIAVVTAFGYALFAGFDVPAVRTACMLLLAGVMRYFLAVPAIFKMLLILAVAMAWSDVFVLWQAGFWLSFIAVAVLVAYSQRWERDNSQHWTQDKSIGRKLFNLFKLQLWMSVALLPISLWLFGKVSLWGFGVNLIAIGLFGWVIVPLNLLASVIYVVMPNNGLPSLIWSILFSVLDRVHQLLQALQNIFQQSGWLHTQMSLPVMGLLSLMVLPWLLPKAMLNRIFSLLPLMAIAVLLYANPTGEDEANNPIHIVVLNPNNPQLAASVIHNKQQAWLLVSTYEKKYQSDQLILTVLQQKKVSEVLYDQLKKNNISHLTGIIVQTETASLAPVVAQLNSFMPVSYYWQAGLNQHKSAVDTALSGFSLQAQSCHSGKQWSLQPLIQQQEMITEKLNFGTETPNSKQQAMIHYSAEMSLKALTGWDQINDSRVWDCALELATTQPVYLQQQGSIEQLFPAIKDIAMKNARDQVNSEANRVVLYSSAEPQLAKLWQLICASQSPSTKANDPLNPKLNAEQKTVTSQQATVLNNYWLTPSQAIIETTLIDSVSTNAWTITGQSIVPAKPQLIESHLYWQQSQSLANSIEK